MAGVTVEWALNKLTPENLRQHCIIKVPERRIARLAIYLLNISNSGMIAEYRVRIEKFRVYVKILNLQVRSTFIGGSKGKGTYGNILEKSVATQKFVAKVQTMDISKKAIEDVVREVAISKLCSMLGVGPAVETSIPFDVIVYVNAVQFHLEKCEQYSKQIL
jgi:hypothetical protein